MLYKKYLKGNSCSFIMTAVFICLSFYGFAQQKNFIVPVEFMVENGNTDQTTVKVMKGGKTLLSMPGRNNMRLKLDFNNSYQITFSKEGYISKSIAVETMLPADRLDRPIEPYKIGVKIFKQYEGINIVVYNQPVAKIHYSALVDEFDFDTDYTKSILSKLNETEHQLERKAAEERLTKTGTAEGQSGNNTIQNNTSTTSGQLHERSLMQDKSDATKQDQSFFREPMKDDATLNKTVTSGSEKDNNIQPSMDDESEKIPDFKGADDARGTFVPAGDDDLSTDIQPAALRDENAVSRIASHDLDIRPKNSNEFGDDIYNGTLRHANNTSAYRTQWKEKGRTITVFKIVNGVNTAEYRKVDYEWGGLYYFKDQCFTISQNVYEWATGER